MDFLRQYLISIVSAAVLCGIFTRLMPDGLTAELLKLVCGIFMTLTLLNPLTQLKHFSLDHVILSPSHDGGEAAAAGEDLSREATARIIKAESEAYILDKAAEMNLTLEVDITVSKEYPPVLAAARITGEISPYAKQKLADILTNDLGIAKEDQQWIGRQ